MMTITEIANYVDWVQLLGALTGGAGAYLMASPRADVRQRAFQLFAMSNGFLIVWSIGAHAWWILLLQLYFTFTSARGIWMNRRVVLTSQHQKADI